MKKLFIIGLSVLLSGCWYNTTNDFKYEQTQIKAVDVNVEANVDLDNKIVANVERSYLFGIPLGLLPWHQRYSISPYYNNQHVYYPGLIREVNYEATNEALKDGYDIIVNPVYTWETKRLFLVFSQKRVQLTGYPARLEKK